MCWEYSILWQTADQYLLRAIFAEGIYLTSRQYQSFCVYASVCECVYVFVHEVNVTKPCASIIIIILYIGIYCIL